VLTSRVFDDEADGPEPGGNGSEPNRDDS